MKYVIIFVTSLLFFSCQNSSEINKDFDCKVENYQNLEEVKDVKNLFSVEIPKNWKTNLYYDALQSSIYTADTTKQLTETLLLDVTYIKKEINFDEDFKLKKEQENLVKKLIQVKTKEIIVLNKPSYYTISKGTKSGFNYQVCEIFMKVNNQNFILAKAEVYGGSLVNERMCKAINLIKKIKTNQ
ncbi:MAG: hypothetical protein V3V28_05490 [Polaribacter sp.]|uniref:hypothetical protein n=1 Tax=Polaribacter sp. TaxID=1920175 RepID=UPI002F360CAA